MTPFEPLEKTVHQWPSRGSGNSLMRFLRLLFERLQLLKQIHEWGEPLARHADILCCNDATLTLEGLAKTSGRALDSFNLVAGTRGARANSLTRPPLLLREEGQGARLSPRICATRLRPHRNYRGRARRHTGL
jgi:hypothetical protein